MTKTRITPELILSELVFTTSRSSGPGGQNVNKVNSKVTLKWDVRGSTILSDEEREVILAKLSTKLTVDGALLLAAQEKRTQLQNKAAAILKLEKLLAKAFEKKKARKATKPSKASVQNRIDKKKKNSEKKQWRQKF